MKCVRFSASLAIKVSPEIRRAVELLAERRQMSLGEAARELLSLGIEARGIEA